MRRSALSYTRGRHAAPGRRLAHWGLFAVATLAGLGLAAALSSSAHASGNLSATITGPANGNSCTLSNLTSETYASALNDLNNAIANCSNAILPVAPNGFASISSTGTLALDYNQGATSGPLTLEGPTKVFGQAAEVLVVGQWATSSDTSPSFAVIVKFSNVDLASLVSGSSSSLNVPLGTAWIATATSTTSVDPTSLPSSVSTFLSSPMTITANALSFRATPATTGTVANALTSIGVVPSSTVLDGTLSASVSGFPGASAPSVSTSLSLTATMSLSNPPNVGWLSLDPSQTLSITGASDGTWSVALSGSGTLSLEGTSAAMQSTITLSGSTSAVSLDLTASVPSVPNAFGLSWLSLSNVQADATLSDTGGNLSASGSLTATVDLGQSNPVGFTFSASLDTSSGFSASLTSTANLSTSVLASDLGISLPTGTPSVSVSGLGIAVQISTTKDVTIAATGTASVNVSANPTAQPITATFLLRVDGATGGNPAILVGLRAPGEKLSSLLGTSVSPDITLPSLSVVLSTSALQVMSSSLDPVTQSFFAATECPTSTPCSYTLDVPQGVGLSASVTLPDNITTLLNNLGLSVAGPVVIDGQLPLFGSTTTDLTLHLPTVTLDSGTVRQIALSLELTSSTDGLGFSVAGDLTLIAPGTGGTTCPDGVAPISGYACLDVHVSAALQVSQSGLSLDLQGALDGGTGWTLQNPSWLTIDALALDVKLTTGTGGAGLQIGMRGSVLVGSTDLTAALDVQLTPEAPWIEPLGFTIASNSGISMADLAKFYNKITGQSIDPSSLPALSLRNLYLSFSTVDNSNLCLQKGFYISADLYLSDATSSSAAPPPCLPTSFENVDPSKSSACSSDSTCLASVRLAVDLSGTSPSISGEGYLGAWNAGPLYFDPTSVQFTLSSSVMQVYISGGGHLLDPVKYATEGSSAPTWASGSLTLGVGTQNLSLDGSVTIGSLSASVHATGALNLSDPGFNLTDWFNQAQQWFTDTGNKINTAMTSTATTAGTWINTYVAPSAVDAFSALNDASAAMTASGQAQWTDLYGVYNHVNSVVGQVNSALSSVGLSSLQINLNTIISDSLHGFSFPGVQICTKLGCVTIVPSFGVPGLCSYDQAIMNTAICTEDFSNFIANAQQYFADPAVTNAITNAGLSMPGSPSSVVQRIHTLDPPLPSSVTCAMSTANYATGTESPTSVTVNSLGHDVTFTEPVPSTFAAAGNLTSEQHDLTQNTFNGLYSGDNSGNCTPPSGNVSAPALTLSLDHSWVTEGDTVTASGYLVNSSATQINVDWGDGSAPSVATVSNGQYSVTHTYADEAGPSTSTPFTVTATLPSDSTVSAHASLSVLDAPLSLGGITYSTPSASAVTSVPIVTPVTLHGSLASPEMGESPTATITWIDGTIDTVAVNADGTFSATHTYLQVAPPGAPSRNEVVSVVVSENDGTQVGASAPLTVTDVAPTNTTAVLVGGNQVGSTFFAHPGDPFSVSGSVQSITPQAGPSFAVQWADGSSSPQTIASPSSGPDTSGAYTYDFGPLSHTYTSACYNPINVGVSDVDGLRGPNVNFNVVVTAPLGAKKRGAGEWLHVLAGAGDAHATLSTAQLTCYLAIAHYLAPSLPSSIAGAMTTLSGSTTDAGPAALLQRTLLTSLLNFANGTWDWTQNVGAASTPYDTLVGNANAALASQSATQLNAARLALDSLN